MSELAIKIDANRKAAAEQNSLDICEMMCGDINRLRYVTRYSTSLVLHRENVAEHSYYVSLYAMLIAHWCTNTYGVGHVKELEVLQRAIVHDLDETRTGDFQRPFKQRTPEFHAMIEKAATEEFHEAVSLLFPGQPEMADWYTGMWADAKDDSREGAVIALADYLSVISHLYAETECANFSVMQHYKSLMEYTKRFDDSKFDFLRPLIVQARDIFDGMTNGAHLQNKIRDL